MSLPRFYISLLMILGYCTVNAQSGVKYAITGSVVADSTKAPLEGATVMLLLAADSSLVNFGRSETNGAFELTHVPNDKSYLLRITYVGYSTYDKTIPAGNTQNPLALGLLALSPQSTTLGEVTVKAEHIPVTIKKDTIEYNAQAFSTKPNAVVEDLLKKMPGIEVDQDGTVRAQGEQVRRVMVDGKEFFGQDPKIATQNLPADAVDKVQVFDKKSDAATFSGIDDGQREKALNLKLKADRKQGVFGSVNGGYGTDNRYDGRVSLNRFNDKRQLALLAMGNNINRQGFSIEDYLSFTGQLQRMRAGGAVRIEINAEDQGIPLDFGGNNGLTTTWGAGLNFNNKFTDKTEVNGSYFYNMLDNKLERSLNRQTFLPDDYFSVAQQSTQNSRNDNHRLNAVFDHKIDSMNLLKLSASGVYNETDISTLSDSRTSRAGDQLMNEGLRQNQVGGAGSSLNTNLLYRHKFSKKGRSLSANVLLNSNTRDRDGELTAVNRYYDEAGALLRTDSISQTNNQRNDVLTFGGNASYTEPLGKRKYLEMNYAYQQSATDLDRNVYDVSNGESQWNESLSNRYRNIYDYHRGGLNFKLNRKAFNLTTGVQLQQSGLDGKLLLQDTSIQRSFTNVLPSLHFNYDFSMSSHFNIDYETNVREPNIEQLQPIVDNSDPLNIYVGNPNLKPEYNHEIGLRYASFNQATLTNLFANINLTYTANSISEAQTIDDLLVRTWRPVNVKDEKRADIYLNYGFPIRKIKSRIGFTTNTMWSSGISLINEVENKTDRTVLGGEARYEFNIDEKFDFNLSANISYNQTTYSLNKTLNQEFINQVYGAGFNWYLPVGFIMSSTMDYSVYNGIAGSGSQTIPLWGAALSKSVMKKRAEIKLSVFDILNKNIGFNRRADVNYLEEERIRSLGRYGMLSFTYSLSPANPGPGGGMQMRFIQRR